MHTNQYSKLQPASALLLGDFNMRRRFGGSLKDVQWMGEAFAVKHYVGVEADDAAVGAEMSLLTSVPHTNVAHCRYCFRDEEKLDAFLVKTRSGTADACLLVKVAGFGGQSAGGAVTRPGRKASHAAVGANANGNGNGNGIVNPCIWYTPEVLENDGPGQAAARHTEKADVYSFGMSCSPERSWPPFAGRRRRSGRRRLGVDAS